MKNTIDTSLLLNKKLDNNNKKPKALGRGLSALLGEVESTKVSINNPQVPKPKAKQEYSTEVKEAPKEDGKNVVLIKIEHIAPNINQPRRLFDDEKIKDLASSIKEKGIIQPLIVRRLNNLETDYEIVAGERRFRAASFLKLKEVPCIVVKATDIEVLEIALIENIQRENLSPIDEAEAYNELLVTHNHTHESLSHAVSKSRPYISNYLRLLSLPNAVKNMVNQRLISVGHARCLINSQNPEKIAELIISKKLSVRETEKLVNDEKSSTKEIVEHLKNPDQVEYIQNLQKDISSYLNRDVVIKQDSKGKGYIKVKFLSIEDVYRWFDINKK